MSLVSSIHEAALPPKQWRVANHYWQIDSTLDSGFILVVSDQLPICHITGGGASDLQPVIEQTISGSDFQSRWTEVGALSRGDMISTEYRNVEEPEFYMVISRSKKPGERLDRIQVLVSASYAVGG